MNVHRSRRKALASLAGAILKLAVAGSAAVEPNQTPAPAKKGCSIQLQGPGAGQSIVYQHGYKFSIYGENDKETHTYTRNDGTWEETVTLTAGVTKVKRFAVVGTADAPRIAALR